MICVEVEMTLLKSLGILLKHGSVSKIELTAMPPFAKIVFDKEELVALLQSQSLVSEAVDVHFVRRQVFWQDIRKENRDDVLKSLTDAESQLDGLKKQLAGSKNASALGLVKFLSGWATACSTTAKTLRRSLKEIEEQKAYEIDYESACDDRQKVLGEALVSLRQTVYPLVEALVAFLPEDDSAKKEAQELLNTGLNLMPNAKLLRGCFPQWDEAKE